MPTPRRGYSLNGKKVPGVTTVIGRYKETGALFGWVHRCGRDGIDYKVEGRNAANIGTAAHDAIERSIKGEAQVPNPTEFYELAFGGRSKAKSCFEAWKRWDSLVKPTYEEIEPQLVHDLFGFGGTIDAVGVIDDTRCIIDWKTSNSIYDETALQVAAYSRLWENNNPEQPIDVAYVLRMDKKSGKYEQFQLTGLDRYYQHFLKQLELYREHKELFPAPWVKVTEHKLKKAHKA